MATEFAHLHLHTEYSLLDGIGRIAGIHQPGARGRHPACRRDRSRGDVRALEWYRQATKAGLHPIVGIEAYLAEGKASVRERKSYHLLLLAENIQGYRNLLQLASKASLEGFYYRPRIDLEMLQQHQEGLIATSACLGGPVANNFLHEQIAKARDYAGTLAEIFGPERFFIEIQDHGITEQKLANDHLIPMAREAGLPLVATNDVHYVSHEDSPTQDLVVCVQTNTTLTTRSGSRAESDQLYFKSPEEMWDIFKDAPGSIIEHDSHRRDV